MDSSRWTDSDSDDDNVIKEGQSFEPNLFCLLIAIDTGKSMFSINQDGKSFFMNSIDACYQLAKSLLLVKGGSIKGPMAIVFVNNDENEAKLVDFNNNVLEVLNLLKSLKDLSHEEAVAKFERKEDLNLLDFFMYCHQAFIGVKGNVFRRTVFYITNDDDPVKNDITNKKQNIISVMQNLFLSCINLQVVTFKPDFNAEYFYKDVLSAAQASDAAYITDSAQLLEKISPLIHNKYTKYRIDFYPIRNNTNKALSLVIHKFIKNSKLLKNMHVTRQGQKEVIKGRTENDSVNEESFKGTFNKEMAPLHFNLSEKMCFRESNLPIGLHLVCVGNSTYNEGWVIEGASLIDKHYKETDPSFDIMWEFCRINSKCLICLRKFKKCGELRYLELVPQCVNNIRMFLARVFPYGTEIFCNFPSVPKQKSIPEAEEAMSKIVEALTFNYDPHDFEHPVEGKKKAYLKSQLLDEPMESVHTGIPSEQHIDKLIQEDIKKLEQFLPKPVPEKKKRTALSSNSVSKKQRNFQGMDWSN